jgi:hypothetical protein
VLQRAARLEVGGPPAKVPMAWANRSPMHFVREIAKSGVPLELWWSKKDRVVRDQARQSGAFFDRMRALEPDAPVEAFVGYWRHSHEQSAAEKLPFALAQLGLLPDRYLRLPGGVQEHHFIPRRRFVRDAR